ncbi:unnamed protein product [Chrysodeixis includens]|uniref:FLYWCH-type domain-containing protein n=1 Tax=Chrysodeixis includens TaxID=689277 RepID=A0A9P0FPT0_CHRIL|nr:unnamed protein product [Chrysodeixis includens]
MRTKDNLRRHDRVVNDAIRRPTAHVDGIQFIDSRRGGQLLLYQGNSFTRNKVCGKRQYWVCKDRSGGCRVTILTYESSLIKIRGEHNHPTKFRYVEEFIVKTNRGCFLMAYDHKFHKKRERGSRVDWTCSRRKATGCRAAVTTHDHIIIRRTNKHNHR